MNRLVQLLTETSAGFSLPGTTPSSISEVDSAIVTGVAGYVIYRPENYDGTGATKYPILFWFHGAGDGRNSYPLSRITSITIMNYLSSTDKNFIVVAPQSTTAGWESGRIENVLDYFNNTTDGLLKDVIDIDEIHVAGYSAGTWGIADLFEGEGTEWARVNSFTPIAGNLSDAYTLSDEAIANGSKMWVFCATGDGVAGTTTSRTFFKEWYDNDTGTVRITEFSSLGDPHTDIQDLVYNDLGISEAQQTGNFDTSYPFYEWTAGSWWDWL